MSTVWGVETLGALCTFENGDRGKNYPSRSAFVEQGIPFINAGNLCNEGINKDTLNHISRERYDLLSNGKIRRGDILFCLRGSLGKFAIVEDLGEGAIASSLVIIRNGKRLSSEYLAQYLKSPLCDKQIATYENGAAQPNLSARDLKAFEIPLPPLPEQRHIAAILDKADAIRRKRQQAIRLTEEFLRSVFLDMFGDPVLNPKGWPEKRLDEISEIQSGITKGRKANGQEMLSVPYMRVANVQDGHIDLGEIKEIEATSAEIARYLLKKGDILLTEGGDPDKLGRGAVWHGEIDPCIHQNHIFRVRPNTEFLLPEYASAQIGSIRGKKYFLKSAKQTTGIASINKTQLSGFPALIPPVALQEKFVEIVRKQEELIAKNSEAASNKDDCFNSLVQRAFQGEL